MADVENAKGASYSITRKTLLAILASRNSTEADGKTLKSVKAMEEVNGLDGLCANYANGLMGASIAMERCSANAGWTFVSQEDYEVTGEEGDAYMNSRKLSRWRRLLDMDGS